MKSQSIGLMALALLFVVAACQPAPEPVQREVVTFKCADGTVVQSEEDCPTQVLPDVLDNEEEPEVEHTDSEFKEVFDDTFGSDENPTQEVVSQLLEMRARAVDKTKNGYTFRYLGIQQNLPIQTLLTDGVFYVREELIAFDLDDPERIIATDETFDYIIMDTVEEKSTLYCSSCVEKIIGDGSEYYGVVITPFEWLMALEQAEYQGEESNNGRTVYRMTGSVEGRDVELLIDTFSGLVMQVVDGDVIHNYDDLGVGVSEDRFALAQ